MIFFMVVVPFGGGGGGSVDRGSADHGGLGTLVGVVVLDGAGHGDRASHWRYQNKSQISAVSGQFATGYGLFAAGAGPALDDLARADERLSTRRGLDSVVLRQIWF
jgi:hypothetical protein